MSYCAYEDLVEAFGAKEISQLTNQVGPCPAVFNAISAADGEIDAYLSVRYSLPLATPVPSVIKRCACELARYFLWDDNATNHVRQRYEDSVGLLKNIAAGSVELPMAGTVLPATKSTVAFFSSPSVWAR